MLNSAKCVTVRQSAPQCVTLRHNATREGWEPMYLRHPKTNLLMELEICIDLFGLISVFKPVFILSPKSSVSEKLWRQKKLRFLMHPRKSISAFQKLSKSCLLLINSAYSQARLHFSLPRFPLLQFITIVISMAEITEALNFSSANLLSRLQFS